MDGDKRITPETFRINFPECYTAIWNEAFEKGVSEGRGQGYAHGYYESPAAKEERETQPADHSHESATLSLEDQAKAKWRTDPRVRAEFGNIEGRYLAYVRGTKEL